MAKVLPATYTVINRFERAVRAHEGRGGSHPYDQPAIEDEFNNARHALIQHIANLNGKDNES